MILKYDIFLLTQARYSIEEITIPNAHVKLFQNKQADYDFSSGRNKTSMFIQLKIIFIEYGKRCISYRKFYSNFAVTFNMFNSSSVNKIDQRQKRFHR